MDHMIIKKRCNYNFSQIFSKLTDIFDIKLNINMGAIQFQELCDIIFRFRPYLVESCHTLKALVLVSCI